MTPSWAQRRLNRRAQELLGLAGTTVEGVGGEGEASNGLFMVLFLVRPAIMFLTDVSPVRSTAAYLSHWIQF
eukprot:3721674-Amphidinium_carterae.1